MECASLHDFKERRMDKRYMPRDPKITKYIDELISLNRGSTWFNQTGLVEDIYDFIYIPASSIEEQENE